MPDYSQIRSLFLRYMQGTLAAGEREQLSEAAETYSLSEWEQIVEPLAVEIQPGKEFDIRDWEQEIQYILSQAPIKKPVPLYRTNIFKWVAAASIIIIVGILVMLSQSKQDKTEQPLATNDVSAPTETRAVITLADGRKIYLDSADNGTLAQQNSVAIIKNSEGGIQYLSPAGGGGLNDSPNNKRPGVDYNTLSNPRGSKVISLALSDGSHVWLNAGSSVKYPVAFIGKERIVEMTGEAYFEVKHNAQQPFKVHLPNGSVVEDIGTSFNINAYADEADIKTTLIEGIVKVEAPALKGTPFSKGGKPTRSVVLSPGQQALVTLRLSKGDILVQDNIDMDEVLAWKNGLFSFNNTDLKTVMRQVARWYDVDIVFEDGVSNEAFMGGISRQENISALLKVLEATNKVHFKIEGKKITVTK